jgi:hypothetical protein
MRRRDFLAALAASGYSVLVKADGAWAAEPAPPVPPAPAVRDGVPPRGSGE